MKQTNAQKLNEILFFDSFDKKKTGKKMANANNGDESDNYSSGDDFEVFNSSDFQRLTFNDINFVTQVLDDLFLGQSSKYRITRAPEYEGFRYPLLSELDALTNLVGIPFLKRLLIPSNDGWILFLACWIEYEKVSSPDITCRRWSSYRCVCVVEI